MHDIKKEMLLPTKQFSKCGVKEGSSTALGICSKQNHCLCCLFTALGASLPLKHHYSVLPWAVLLQVPSRSRYMAIWDFASMYGWLPWSWDANGNLLCHLYKITRMSVLLGHRWPSSISWIYFCSSKGRIRQPKGHDLLQTWLQKCSTSVNLVWKLKSQSRDNYQQLSFLPCLLNIHWLVQRVDTQSILRTLRKSKPSSF